MSKEVKSRKELDEVYNKIAEDKKSEGTLIYNELIFMLETLDKLRDEIKSKGATEHFINGKQDFIRENPALLSYNKMLKSYDIFYKHLINLLPKEQDTSDDDDFDRFIDE